MVRTIQTIITFMVARQEYAELIGAYARVRKRLVSDSFEPALTALFALRTPTPFDRRKSTMSSKKLQRTASSRRKKDASMRRKSSLASLGASSSNNLLQAPKTPGHRRTPSKDRAMDDYRDDESLVTIYDKGTHPYVHYSRTIIRAMQREQSLIKRILEVPVDPDMILVDFGELAHDMEYELFSPLVEVWVSQGELLYTSALERRFAVMGGMFVYDILCIFHDKMDDINGVIDKVNQELVLRLHGVTVRFAELGRQAMLGFQERILKDDINKIPPDGTVHELTSSSLSFLTSLYEYDDIVGSLLHENFKNQNRSELNLPGKEASVECMSRYLNEVLETLQQNLEMKARSYEVPKDPDAKYSRAKQAIFLMNNFDYILRYLATSPYTSVLRVRAPEIQGTYQQRVIEQRRSYQNTTWNEIVSIIEVPEEHKQGVSGNLSKRERESIKTKYSRFNEEFEKLLQYQEKIAIPNKDLCRQIHDDNAQYILPLYQAFDDTYRNSGFSVKNPWKYLDGNTFADVQKNLLRFFGAH